MVPALTDIPTAADSSSASGETSPIDDSEPADSRLGSQAEAAALAGDLDTALRLADQVVADPESPDRIRATMVTAAVLAQRGLLTQSAELYRWLATVPGASVAVAVPTLIGTGVLTDAPALLAATNTFCAAPPTSRAGAELLMAQGIHETIVGDPAAALSALVRAAALLEPSGRSVLLPDSPAALAAVVASHCGELEVADSVLNRAISGELGGRAAVTRHRLLRAWVAMLSGDLAQAYSLGQQATAATNQLEPRDELVAAALNLGLARRNGDLTELSVAWTRAKEAVLRYPVDLYVLQQLGECLIASAKLGEQHWLETQLAAANTILDRLGRPVLWSASLHWAGVQAAIAAGQPVEANRHASALFASAPRARYPAALALATQCWLRVLDARVETQGVLAAARGLRAVGLRWDAARLAGQAAIRTTDRKAMSTLLNCARGMVANIEQEIDREKALPTVQSENTQGPLSAREKEVAELVIDGLTYKQVGERLFISAKTVEHHVARIRQRLGSATRAELLSTLRLMLAGQGNINPIVASSIVKVGE